MLIVDSNSVLMEIVGIHQFTVILDFVPKCVDCHQIIIHLLIARPSAIPVPFVGFLRFLFLFLFFFFLCITSDTQCAHGECQNNKSSHSDKF